MITLAEFLVFLFAASLPVCYLLIMRHFIEGSASSSADGERVRVAEKKVDRSKFAAHGAPSLATSH